MSRKLLVVACVAAALVLAGVSSTEGADRFQIATGQELVTALLNPGTITCIGGEVAPPPMLCTPGTTQIHVRGRVASAIYINLAGEAAALIDGTNTLGLNCNLDGSMRGRCWGTFRWDIPAQGGQWDGIWTGEFDNLNIIATFTATCHGSGGALEGLQLKVDGTYPGGVPYGDIVARVLVPGN